MDDLYFAIAHPLNSKRKLMPFSELYTLYGETEVYRSLYAYPREALDYNGELKDYPTRLVYDIGRNLALT